MTRNKGWPTPTQQSRDSMSYLVTTSKRTANLQLPHGFLRDGDAPPLARLVQGGRGGEVRLKLYLTVSLIAAAAPHTYDRNTPARSWAELRSEEHTSELQSLMRISYAVFGLEQKQLQR